MLLAGGGVGRHSYRGGGGRGGLLDGGGKRWHRSPRDLCFVLPSVLCTGGCACVGVVGWVGREFAKGGARREGCESKDRGELRLRVHFSSGVAESLRSRSLAELVEARMRQAHPDLRLRGFVCCS